MMKWKKNTLFFVVAAVVVSAAVAACVFFVPSLRKRSGITSEHRKSNKSELPAGLPYTQGSCSTRNCVLSAARILKYIDVKVDPCEDFYNYTCGNFIHSHPLPEGWDHYGNDDIINAEADLKIKGILEEQVKINESKSLVRAKKVFQTCMDLSHIENSFIEDLKDALSKKGVGEWPLLNSKWKDCRLDLEWRMAKLNAMGSDSLFRLDTQFKEDDYRIITVLSVAPPLVEGICDGDSVDAASDKINEHKEILQSILSLLGVQVTNVTEKDIDEIYEFDYLFCSATKASREQAVTIDESRILNMTLLNLADLAPQINWIRWRNLIFSEIRLDFPYNKQNIYVNGVEASIEDINELLHNTSSKVLANYMSWKFVVQHLGFLGKPLRQLLENHSELMAPQVGNLRMNSDRWIQRWRQCVIYIKQMMPMALLPEYTSQINMHEKEKEMQSITSLVANEFRKILKDTQHLLPNDQMKSAHKIDLIQMQLTYPNKDKKFLDKYYSDLGSMGDSFLKNGMKLGAIRLRKLLEVSTSKTIYDMEYAIHLTYSPFSANTHSFFRGNQIVVSLEALDSYPVNDYKLPRFLTLSTFGWTIGHELAHGFDLNALDGNTKFNWTTWPTYALLGAKTRAKCYLDNFPHYGKSNVDEALKSTTLNEDLCDNQGMYLAYMAYLRYLGHHGEDDTLPGLPFSNRELFFITYAQQFCEIRNSKSSHASHSPGRRRVNQVLKNFGPFSETFRCFQKKPMNDNKCNPLWL